MALYNGEPTKTLTLKEKEKIIQEAIQSKAHYNLREWGSMDMWSLLASDESMYVGIEGANQFFTELLLFVAQPVIASSFDNAVDDGLGTIKKFLEFFKRVDTNYYFDEWNDLMRATLGLDDDNNLERLANKYLTGPDLEAVLTTTLKEDPARARMMALFEKEQARDRARWEEREAALFDSFILKTDEQLVAALDKYYPGEQWPADKITIARQRRMIEHLNELEAEQSKRQGEALEIIQERTISRAVFNAINRREHAEFLAPVKAAPVKKTATTKKA